MNAALLVAVSVLLTSLAYPALGQSNQEQTIGMRVLTIDDAFSEAKKSNLAGQRSVDEPTIVFVPGILGSRLDFGNYVFGRDPITSRDLIFDPAKRPTASTMNEFVIGALSGLNRSFSRRDVYGDALDQLQTLNNGRAVEEFSYDWRADIDESAETLESWLRSKQLHGKPVIFIAHSMGGLVVWRWLQVHRKTGADGVQVRKLFVIGSPLQGACEAVRMVVDGYQAQANAGVFEAFVTRLLFENAHAALFTFPSVFQLLPAYNRRDPCLLMRAQDKGEDPIDHHEPDFWLGRQGGKLGLLTENSALWPSLVNSSGVSAEEYERRVRAAINAGRRFRKELRLAPPPDVQVAYLASTDHQMPRGYKVQPDRGTAWVTLTAITESSSNGDGRVLMRSAFNEGFGNFPTVSRHPIRGSHGELMKDASLIAFLRPNLMAAVQEVKAIAVGVLLRDSSAAKLFERSIIDPAMSGKRLTDEGATAQKIIAQFNASRVGNDSGAPAIRRLVDLGTRDGDFLVKGSPIRFKSALIESAAVLQPSAVSQAGVFRLKSFRGELGEIDYFVDGAYRLGESRTQDGMPWWQFIH